MATLVGNGKFSFSIGESRFVFAIRIREDPKNEQLTLNLFRSEREVFFLPLAPIQSTVQEKIKK
jgi:hypothetical protein